jgi:hypothetical protein
MANDMNIALLIANVLTGLAFALHTFVGDKELKINQPAENTENFYEKIEKWTMARCGWHWVSVDLLLATIGLGLVNFTNYFDSEKTILQLLAIYFFGYGTIWLFTIFISASFPKNYLKLGQWFLLLIIGGLIVYGSF